MTVTTTHPPVPAKLDAKSRLEPFMAIIAPLSMILMILVVMGIMEPARYFRLSNFNIILLEAAL
ncbi:MAG: ABC transporter permease, partial [Pseudomonadota bacterium]